MKKLFFSLFLAMATVSFMTSCDKEKDDELTDGTEQTDGDETNGGDETDGPEDPAEEVSLIVGSWVCTYINMSYMPGGGYVPDPDEWAPTFNADGTYTEIFYGDPGKGTYIYEEEAQKLTTYENGLESYAQTYTVDDLNDSTMVLSTYYGDIYTFTRQ